MGKVTDNKLYADGSRSKNEAVPGHAVLTERDIFRQLVVCLTEAGADFKDSKSINPNREKNQQSNRILRLKKKLDILIPIILKQPKGFVSQLFSPGNQLVCRRLFNSVQIDLYIGLIEKMLPLIPRQGCNWNIGSDRSNKPVYVHPIFCLVLDSFNTGNLDLTRLLLGSGDVVAPLMISLNKIEQQFILRQFSPQLKIDYIYFYLRYHSQVLPAEPEGLDKAWVKRLLFSSDISGDSLAKLLRDEFFLRLVLSPCYRTLFRETVETMRPEIKRYFLINLCVLLGVVKRNRSQEEYKAIRQDWIGIIGSSFDLFSAEDWLLPFKITRLKRLGQNNTRDYCALDYLFEYSDDILGDLFPRCVKQNKRHFEEMITKRYQTKGGVVGLPKRYSQDFVRLFRVLLIVQETEEQALRWLSTWLGPGPEEKPLLLAMSRCSPGLEMMCDFVHLLSKIDPKAWTKTEADAFHSPIFFLCYSEYIQPTVRHFPALVKEKSVANTVCDEAAVNYGIRILSYWLQNTNFLESLTGNFCWMQKSSILDGDQDYSPFELLDRGSHARHFFLKKVFTDHSILLHRLFPSARGIYRDAMLFQEVLPVKKRGQLMTQRGSIPNSTEALRI